MATHQSRAIDVSYSDERLKHQPLVVSHGRASMLTPPRLTPRIFCEPYGQPTFTPRDCTGPAIARGRRVAKRDRKVVESMLVGDEILCQDQMCRSFNVRPRRRSKDGFETSDIATGDVLRSVGV